MRQQEQEATHDEGSYEKLRELGLSEYAARAYLAALRLGKAEAKTISAVARVPPSKIYEVLGNLEEAGLLQVFPEFPKQYGALTLAPYLERLQRQHQNTLRRIEQEREDLLRMFSPARVSAPSPDPGDVVLIRGAPRIMERRQDLIRGARRTWTTLGVERSPQRMLHHAEDIRNAYDRGVQFQLIHPVTPDNEADARRLMPYVDVRQRLVPPRPGSEHVSITIVDDATAILSDWLASDGNRPGATDFAIFTDERGIVQMLRSLVDLAHEASSPLPRRAP
jgi:sugar-specific transcriptional regulator TrmB